MHTNRLIHEKSPYLQQHAHNPVDWYPWGNEAFIAAKQEDKPIFLSIGYATCHWCHVMEQESFENVHIAKLMNQTFINIKVDREEMPEVDALYMDFAQAIIASGGGWPLNVILTPDLKPFFATTYVPADSRIGSLGLVELISQIQDMWMQPEERDKLIEQADKIFEIFNEKDAAPSLDMPTINNIEETAQLFFRMADPLYGGIKGAPKFPIGYHSCFLLRYGKLTGEGRAYFFVDLTLEMMSRGGIHDHIGGGFSRYSVDDRWQIPHFEKMLYDNAILARIYTEAWQVSKKQNFKQVVDGIFNYLIKEMKQPHGGFYSAQDADSEGKEGYYYTWTRKELEVILGQDANLFFEYYNVRYPGNFEGRSVLSTTDSLEEFCERHEIDVLNTDRIFKECREKLLNLRKKRKAPIIDNKIIVSWNGLIIYSLAYASMVFDNQTYLESAYDAAHFIRKEMWKDKKLLRRYCDKEARYDGGLDDYAFLIHGILMLFEVDGNALWLHWALEMTEVIESKFKMPDGAYYTSVGEDPYTILKQCEMYDGAEPSGNGIHCENLLRLYQITHDKKYLSRAEDILRKACKSIEEHPVGCCYLLMALQRYLDKKAPTVVVALNSDGQWQDLIKATLSKNFQPHRVVIWNEVEENLGTLIPDLKLQTAIKDTTTLYLCSHGLCKTPANDQEKIQDILNGF